MWSFNFALWEIKFYILTLPSNIPSNNKKKDMKRVPYKNKQG